MSKPRTQKPKRKASSPNKTLEDWEIKAFQALSRLVVAAKSVRELRARGPTNRDWEIDVRAVSAPAMKRLNSGFLGKSYATDVLSFPTAEPFRSQGQLGALVVCVPVLLRQAKERGFTAEMELNILLVHGLLHLLGFDHEEGQREAAIMARFENALLKKTVPAAWVRATRGECLKGLVASSSK